jgi:hypothetical protein
MTKSIMPQNFPYVSSRTLRSQHFEIGKFGEAALRKKLPSPLYWIQPDRKVLWNLYLIKDLILNGDRPAHTRFVEQYLASLPTTKIGANHA